MEVNSAPTLAQGQTGNYLSGSDVSNPLTRTFMEIPIVGSAMKQQWAEQREDTAIQRQMADMKQAGLNPILAYSGGQGAASSAASATAGNSGLTNGMINSANSYYANKTKKEIAAENNQMKESIAQISSAIELAKMFI